VAEELRRGFHDRLAGVHADVGRLVRTAAASVVEATDALLAGRPASGVASAAGELLDGSAMVEREVFDLLALQAPVARDLRLLLASMRVAHEAELSAGLAATIAFRVDSVNGTVLEGPVREVLAGMAHQAGDLFGDAAAAYEVLDADLAEPVIAAEGAARESHRRFLGELFRVRDAPIERAVELGIIARSYERIADHAVEIAHRVRFVAVGADEPV
jgi:phosphate transport system protein